ncbi:hypothetical protein B296_00005367 [Ensete ventricosum]|uniref:Uncharacterized protein n=1 Tax=Ensete ventricosum TaxID=4639 RepID=A0A427B4D7_ENSVE|nr:hypothetical protein B296_00005367 [Ensete ventricosum]
MDKDFIEKVIDIDLNIMVQISRSSRYTTSEHISSTEASRLSVNDVAIASSSRAYPVFDRRTSATKTTP